METRQSQPEAQATISAACYLAVLLLPVSACLGAVTFFDGTFNDADWDVIRDEYGNGGTVTISQRTGGNPGEYRHIVNTVDPSPGGGEPSGVLGFHKCLAAVYDPQTQGAIASIDYSEDSIMFSGFGHGQATGPALMQDGLVYYYLPSLYCNQRSWTTQTLHSLTAEDFLCICGAGVCVPEHPDFSALGRPIVFGFWRGNSSRYYGYTIVAGIDNWSLTVTSVRRPVGIDIKPQSCPNPLNPRSRGVLPVAILGREEFDVATIDPTSIRLEGAAPLRWSIEDVATPVAGEGEECECTTEGEDGYLDLTLKFAAQEIAAALGDLSDDEVISLALTGALSRDHGSTPIHGRDCVVIRAKVTQGAEEPE